MTGASTLRHAIGTKIFAAFFAMSIIIAGMGAYAHYVLSMSGDIVADTYDKPMMAINFARAASVDFLQMQNGVLRARSLSGAKHAAASKQIDELAKTLSDDLDVAEERSPEADERKVIEDVRALIHHWQRTRHNALAKGMLPELQALDAKILDRFDMLIELNADHGFVSRRAAITEVGDFGYTVVLMTGLAILIAGIITLLIRRRVSRPLSMAAGVADRIAAGEFDILIPRGGRDEIGALLNSMTVMQRSIVAHIAHEKARAQSAESRLVDAIENSGEGVILSGADGVVAISSSEVPKFFPDIAGEIQPGRRITDALQRIEQQSSSEYASEQPLSGLLSIITPDTAVATERQLPDGRWVRFTASRTSEGGTILFISDFTDIKAREERYRAAKQQAEEASIAKTRFLSNMSHELRTPLNAILGFSEMMTTEIFGRLGSPRYLEYAHDILRSGRHLLEVINSVLDIAKSESGKMSLSPEPVDLQVVLQDCARMLSGQYEAANVALTMNASVTPFIVSGEEAKLRQIFINLMSNAVKFTEPGGAVTITPRTDDDGIVVEVADTGIGMAADEIPIALTPFAQIDNRLERRYEGTGLGLPLARTLTELHGGHLEIESEPGEGTVVRVHLPRCAEDLRAAPLAVAS
jgi:signal transduction histidine kinase